MVQAAVRFGDEIFAMQGYEKITQIASRLTDAQYPRSLSLEARCQVVESKQLDLCMHIVVHGLLFEWIKDSRAGVGVQLFQFQVPEKLWISTRSFGSKDAKVPVTTNLLDLLYMLTLQWCTARRCFARRKRCYRVPGIGGQALAKVKTSLNCPVESVTFLIVIGRTLIDLPVYFTKGVQLIVILSSTMIPPEFWKQTVKALVQGRFPYAASKLLLRWYPML